MKIAYMFLGEWPDAPEVELECKKAAILLWEVPALLYLCNCFVGSVFIFIALFAFSPFCFLPYRLSATHDGGQSMT